MFKYTIALTVPAEPCTVSNTEYEFESSLGYVLSVLSCVGRDQWVDKAAAVLAVQGAPNVEGAKVCCGFGLESVLLTEGGILDPCCEI